jgi:fructose-1-phosphate kinase PfkB-like protein
MIVSIKGHSYQMKRKEFDKMVKVLKKSIKKKPTILAVEKDNFAEMRNDIYSSQDDLTTAITKWHKQGFSVKYIRG